MPGDPENQARESPQTASSSTQQSAVLIHRSGLPPFPPFDPLSNPANTGPRWRKWLRRFENLLISLRETDPIVKRGLLLTYVGETTNDIFEENHRAQQLEKSVLNVGKSDILVNTVCQNNGNQQVHHVSTTTSNKSVIVIGTKNRNATTEGKSVVCQNNNQATQMKSSSIQ